MHAHEVPVHEMHTREVHAHEIHTREVHAYEVHAHKVQAHETHTREMRAHEFLRGPSASEHRRTSVPAPARVSALSHIGFALSHIGFSHRRSVLKTTI